MTGDILFLHQVFSLVLSSLLEMSRRYLRHIQESSLSVQESSLSDDDDEEAILATLHAAQAQHMNAL
jgi:hypothetical protein